MDMGGGAPPMGADPMGGGGPLGADPMGGAPMGGGMPPMGGDPMGGGMGMGAPPAQPTQQVSVPIKDADVWEVLAHLIDKKPLPKQPKVEPVAQDQPDPMAGGMPPMGGDPMGGDPMGGMPGTPAPMGGPPMGGGLMS